ncbi:MAG TPA: hypothetical protein EYG73_02075 [Arcobacter sp.]|nr:hypothetical protein [Arcobacter sp.]
MNIEVSKLDVEYEKEVCFAILMIPVSFFLMCAGLFNWDTFFVFMGLIFAWVFYSYVRSLGYMFLVDKKLSIEATNEYLSWKIYDNDILVNDTKIYKKDEDVASIYKKDKLLGSKELTKEEVKLFKQEKR